VHQPLHCTSRFTQKHGAPEGDRGGNAFKIKPFKVFDAVHPIDNLHSFWDDQLGTSETFTAVRSLATSLMSAFPPQDPIDITEQDWIDESFNAATTFVYKLGKDEPGDPKPKITATYKTGAEAIARQRMALAGYRLAEILNQKFQ
jgi:hypothetical protein